jgi:hypothetical protein
MLTMNTYFAPSGIATSLCFARAYTRTADCGNAFQHQQIAGGQAC